MRYQFYREHKYVSAAVNDLERLIAKTDFRDAKEVQAVLDSFSALSSMLKGHAAYENERLHVLLKRKNSDIYKHVESEHACQDEQFDHLNQILGQVFNAKDEEEKISSGYQFYLAYRKFAGQNLLHLHEEETLILPELQRLYTDEELVQVEAETYQVMTVEEIKEMLKTLFPYMNPTDKEAFLKDIQTLAPEKLQSLRLSWGNL